MVRFLLVFFLVFTAYITFPFLNGVGCNFTYTSQSGSIKDIGRCRGGVLTTYYKDSISGHSSYVEYLYGIDSNYIYMVTLSKSDNTKGAHANSYSNIHQSLNIYNGDILDVYAYTCSNKSECYWFGDSIFNAIYKMNLDGRMGFFPNSQSQ